MSRFEKHWEAVDFWFERFPWVPAVFLAAVIGFVGVLLSRQRIFWFDEIGTVLTMRILETHPILEYLQKGGDMTPPLYFYLVKGMALLTGDATFAGRYLAVAGSCLALLGVYFVAWRRAGWYCGTLAALTLLHTMFLEYLSEGRPYGISLCLCVAAAVAWEGLDGAGARRFVRVAGMATALGAAVSVHYYTVFLLVPLGVGQLVRDVQKRQPNWLVWGGFSVPLLLILAHFPLIRAVRAVYGPHSWQAVNPISAPELYRALWQDTGIVCGLFLLLYWVARRRTSGPGADDANGHRPPAAVYAFLASFLLVPGLAYLAGVITGSLAVPRYVILTVLGISWAPALIIAGWAPARRTARAALLALVALSAARELRNGARIALSPDPAFAWLRENVPSGPGPVLVSDVHSFLQLAYYREAERLPAAQMPDAVDLQLRYFGEDAGIKNAMIYREALPEPSFYPWRATVDVPVRVMALRKPGATCPVVGEALRLGGTVRLVKAGPRWELLEVELPSRR